MSFKLAELLAAAPLRRAGHNQATVLEWAAARVQRRADDGQEELTLEDLYKRPVDSPAPTPDTTEEDSEQEDKDAADDATNESGLISAQDCLERLLSGELEFSIEDLFGDSPSRLISISDSLELLVSPSGVRAVKLVETQ